MQQTTKYQFNLVDATDDFSPAPLNQNMERVEQELDGLSAALTQGLGGLGESMSSGLAAVNTALGAGGHTCRLAFGSYTGSDQAGSSHPNTLSFGFKPLVVFIGTETNFYCWPGVFFQGIGVGKSCVSNSSDFLYVTWSGHCVSWYSRDSNVDMQMNVSRYTYYYVALGYDDSGE